MGASWSCTGPQSAGAKGPGGTHPRVGAPSGSAQVSDGTFGPGPGKGGTDQSEAAAASFNPKSSSSFFSDVEHFIDVFIEAARSHFTQYWIWYSAATIIAILICLMLCYKKQLTAMWKTMLEKRKETQSQSAEEELSEEEEDNRIEIVIVPTGSQPSSAVGQDLPMDFV